MLEIELFYYADCPSHEQALAILREVMVARKIAAPVKVIEVKTEAEAQLYHFYGSPTIRINGADIAPLPEDISQPSLTCRAYRRADGKISPLPPRELIEAALRNAVTL